MGNIMIVEDDLIISNGIKSIIKSVDLRQSVIASAYAKKALIYAKKNDIDLFILDIQLKDYSGVQLAKELRALDQYSSTPIIFVTALITKELEAFQNVNCYEFIIKPFSDVELREVLEIVINKEINYEEKAKSTLLKINQKEFIHTIEQGEIVYIEIRPRRLIIRTIREELVFSAYIFKQIQKEIADYFVQCHKNFFINSKMVENLDVKTSKISFKPIKELVPFSRTYKEIFSGIWL